MRGVELRYDGQNLLRVNSRGRALRLSAMTPAVVGISPDARYLVHNFGNDSGQVYDIRLYSLRDDHPISAGIFKQRVLKFAHLKHTCRPRSYEISYLAEGWISSNSLEIGTEDWTRRPGCESLYRKWRLNLP